MVKVSHDSIIEVPNLKVESELDLTVRVDLQGIHLYGAEAAAVAALPGSAKELGGGLTEAMVQQEWEEMRNLFFLKHLQKQSLLPLVDMM